jgi:hypothetical protein
LVSCGHCIVCPLYYGIWLPPFGILWPLHCLSFVLQHMITPLWYLVAIVLSVLCITASDYPSLVSCGHCIVCPLYYGIWLPPFGILWPLYCLSFVLQHLITPLWYLVAIVLSVLCITASDYPPLVSSNFSYFFKTKTEKIKDYTSALFINQANFDVYVKQTW